jgi:nucleoside-diphosphate-sugar epimerase
MRIFVTGSSSHLAQALLPRLCAHPEIERVIGVDIRPTLFRHDKFEARAMDVRDPRVVARLEGCDALIHLAFVVLRGRVDAHSMHRINVGASQALFNAAAAAGVQRLIHLSSASVYGSGEELAEAAPLAPLAGFLYARHKAKLETWLEAHHPQAVRLRAHVVLGPNAQPLLRWLVRQPCHIRLPDPQPLLQCVHEEDVADAVMLALFNGKTRGPYNLAAPQAFSFREMIARHRSATLPLPMSLARIGLKSAWKLFGVGGEPAWVEGLARPLTLDCGRAQRELAWQPRFSAWDAIDAARAGRNGRP